MLTLRTCREGALSAWQREVERCLLSLHSFSRSIASEAPRILVQGLFNNNNVFFFCYQHGEDFWVGRRFCFCFLKSSHWRHPAWGSRPAREDHRSLKRMRSGAVFRVQREEGFVPAPTHTWSNGVPSPPLPRAHRSRSRFPPRGGARQGAGTGVGLR